MDKVEELRKKYHLKVISDASHAYGATWRGKKIGALDCEDLAGFSLEKNKLISAEELGGLLPIILKYMINYYLWDILIEFQMD